MEIRTTLPSSAPPALANRPAERAWEPVETVSLGQSEAAPPVLRPAMFRAQEQGPIRDINRPGEAVDVESHLVPGKTNIICFWATWSPWSQKAQPKLAKLCQERPEFVCLRVDVQDFESPAARQHGITKVPSYAIYGPEGKLVATGEEARAQVKALFGGTPA